MSIISRWIDKIKRKKRRKIEREMWRIKGERLVDDEGLNDPLIMRNHVVSLCEQMIEICRELDDVRHEYDQVTAYLKDIQMVEELDGNMRKQLDEVATQISKLINVRADLLNAEHKISDEVFNQMEEKEAEIPDVIRRLKGNEADLETIKRDLNLLASEKVEWSVLKQEREDELKHLRRLSYLLLFTFGGITVIVVLLSMLFKWDMLPIFVVAFLASLAAAYVILHMQECHKDIKQSEVNQNYIISLENRIKIKYVNAKNAVDFTCKRFHVKSSKELTFNYEQYIEICKERERFKQTNEDLDYYKNRLVRLLRGLNLYDARMWLNYANAIIDKNEMVELKHEYFQRRQFLRKRIDYNVNAITELRTETNLYVDKLGDKANQVRAIVNKVEELNRGLGIL